MKTINTEKIEKAINHLMNVVDEELEKNGPQEIDDFIDNIAEKMGDEVYQSKAGELMKNVIEMSKPPYKQKYMRLSSALSCASDEAVFLLCNLVASSIRLHEFINRDSLDMSLIKFEANQMKIFVDKAQKEINDELYYRVQGYRNDIEKLTKAS